MTIETKYSIGDTLWFMHDNRINSGVVVKLSLDLTEAGNHEVYTLKRDNRSTEILHYSLLYPSKQNLLASL